MILCHGTDDEPHAPTELVEGDDSDVAGHANLTCPTCGIVLETSENTANRVTNT